MLLRYISRLKTRGFVALTAFVKQELHSKRKSTTETLLDTELSNSNHSKATITNQIISKTTALDATNLDGLQHNPFTNKPYSHNHKQILETKRNLPIFKKRQQFLDLVKENQVVILVGETGSGKTTQIPQYLLYDTLPHLKNKTIGITQPRRVAATSVSKRVSEELDVRIGEEVGYSVRFDEKSSQKTVIKYMTDGMLLREIMHNKEVLNKYSAIILDEAHERTVNTDILMGILKASLCSKNIDKQFKLIVMSATLEANKFSKYFNNAPILKVDGRTYPVEISYLKTTEKNYLTAALKRVIEIHRIEPEGDVLVFLNGEEEIETFCKKARGVIDILQSQRKCGPADIYPLYSILSSKEQNLVFNEAPKNANGLIGRKIVVSTNIAETSLTIDGIVYVVDPGFSKQKVYNPRTRVESLLISPISKAQAQQRSGRAGRTRPGKAYRLYTKEAYTNELQAQTPPEILRSNLGSIVLNMLKAGIKDLVQFDFMDPPAPETMMRALEMLNYIGALDDEGNLTNEGMIMSDFPVAPEMAKAILQSSKFKCTDEVITIAAMLSVPTVFVKPQNDTIQTKNPRRIFADPGSDHITLLNIYNAYKTTNKNKDAFCVDHLLNPRSLRQAENVKEQLKNIYFRNKLDFKTSSLDDCRTQRYSENIKKAMLQGYFMQIAHLQKNTKYVTCKDNQVVRISSSSSLLKKPQWVMFNEFVFTDKHCISTVSGIEPHWLLECAKKYYDPEDFLEGETKKELVRLLGGTARPNKTVNA